MHRFIDLFKQKERDLLPPKKERALDVAEYILTKKVEGKNKNKNTNQSLKQPIRDMLNLLKPNPMETVDYERLAEEWIEILQPYLDKKRDSNKRKKIVLNLSSLKLDYNKIDLNIEWLNEKDDKQGRTGYCGGKK